MKRVVQDVKYVEVQNVDNMKEYNVKYEVGQEVYILTCKAIFKSRVDKIRITESAPWVKLVGRNSDTIEMDGIEIDYLVEISNKPYGNNGSTMTSYDWYKQSDVHLTKDEVIEKIV
jgi:hypothetical protein